MNVEPLNDDSYQWDEMDICSSFTLIKYSYTYISFANGTYIVFHYYHRFKSILLVLSMIYLVFIVACAIFIHITYNI